MRKLAVVGMVLALAPAACSGEGSPTVEPPASIAPAASSGASPAASAPTNVNDKGTETFTEMQFEVGLKLAEFSFEPTFIKSPGGATATVELKNDGSVAHTFTIESLGVDEVLQPDATKTIEVKLGTETRYEFICRFHAGGGMRGAFQPH